MSSTITSKRAKTRAAVQVYSFWLWIGRRVLAKTTGTNVPIWLKTAKGIIDSMNLSEEQARKIDLQHERCKRTFTVSLAGTRVY